MKFNSNKQRRACWQQMNEEQSLVEIETAIATLKEDTARVVNMRYRDGLTLPQIIDILQKSGTTVRNEALL